MKNKVLFILVHKCKMLASIAEKIHNPLSTSVTVRLIIFSAMIATVIFLRKTKKAF